MDIHQSLNWRAVWPLLRRLPAGKPITLLDAGCGAGAWCRRIARRRPAWRVTGIDKDAERIREAAALAGQEGIPNVLFVQGDLVDPLPGSFDVILSVASIHYDAAAGRGPVVLRQFGRALRPRGTIVLVAPRRAGDQPAWRRLPRPHGWPLFTADELRAMAEEGGLDVREIRGLYGPWCMLGKQLAMWTGGSKLRLAATAGLQMLVRMAPIDLERDARARSYAIRLVAGAAR